MLGFNDVSIQYLRSPRNQLYDGLQMGFKSGIYTIVWMPKAVKERIAEFLPEDLIDKITTEEEVQDINTLKEGLKEKNHPIVATWVEMEEEEEWEGEGAMVSMGTVELKIPGAGGFKVILKNCKIHAESIIIKKIESKRKK